MKTCYTVILTPKSPLGNGIRRKIWADNYDELEAIVESTENLNWYDWEFEEEM